MGMIGCAERSVINCRSEGPIPVFLIGVLQYLEKYGAQLNGIILEFYVSFSNAGTLGKMTGSW
jgi:hypothetical protein